MSTGVIYYNKGTKMIVRLAVSLSSLRQHYNGPVTILSEGEDSHKAVEPFGGIYNLDIKEVTFKTPKAKGDTYINATLAHTKTPYDVTVWLDSDTLIRDSFFALFASAAEHEFAICQFSTWKTAGKIGKRIRNWEPLYPDWIQAALDFGPAINCGVFAFRKDSKLMADWWELASAGMHLSWIPDETCCQLILPRYPHIIMPQEYNCSCKHSDPHAEDVKIIHYHGRKHCRFFGGLPINGADLWYERFERVRGLECVKKYIQKDRQLRVGLIFWDKWKNRKSDVRLPFQIDDSGRVHQT